MENKDIAKAVIEAIGGRDNVTNAMNNGLKTKSNR